MSKELITLDQILSDDLRERILEVDSKIRKFIDLVNQEAFEYEKIPILDIIITRKKAHVVYEDDGNIQAKSNSLASTFKIFYGDDANTYLNGYKYDVFWICPVGQHIEPRNYYYFHIMNSLLSNSIYFHYEDKERIRDKYSSGRGRFLSLYASIDKFEERITCEEPERISYENDNYKLGTVINYQNAMNCIFKIKEFREKEEFLYKLKNSEMLDS